MLKDYRVQFTQKEKAELRPFELEDAAAPGMVLGQNVISLISTGSERGGYTQQFRPEQYPMSTGSSSVAKVVKVGEGVTNLKPGDLFFHYENHNKYVVAPAVECIPVPKGLAPEKALFGRYSAVSMTSIYRMKAKPVDSVAVTGLGLVGLMCAQVLVCMGYNVYAVDPSAERREIALGTNLTNVAESLDAWPEMKQSLGALLECSGNENALRAAIPYMRPGSDAFQVGVPWHKNSDWDAHTLLYELFYAYVSLHGGWEWFLPKTPGEFDPHSSVFHVQNAMQLIADGKMVVQPEMYELRDPRDCDKVYSEIAMPRMRPTSMMLDWRLLDE